MKESVGWTSSRLTIRLLNLKRPQLNRIVQVLSGHCNLQWRKKTTGCAESSSGANLGGGIAPWPPPLGRQDCKIA